MVLFGNSFQLGHDDNKHMGVLECTDCVSSTTASSRVCQVLLYLGLEMLNTLLSLSSLVATVLLYCTQAAGQQAATDALCESCESCTLPRIMRFAPHGHPKRTPTG